MSVTSGRRLSCFRGWIADGPEGGVRGVFADLDLHRLRFARDEAADRLAEAGVADPVGAVGERRHEAAFELVLPLRAGLEQRLPPGDGPLDELVVAELEVQHLEVGQTAPVAA